METENKINNNTEELSAMQASSEYIPYSEKGAADGVAKLDSDLLLAHYELPNYNGLRQAILSGHVIDGKADFLYAYGGAGSSKILMLRSNADGGPYFTVSVGNGMNQNGFKNIHAKIPLNRQTSSTENGLGTATGTYYVYLKVTGESNEYNFNLNKVALEIRASAMQFHDFMPATVPANGTLHYVKNSNTVYLVTGGVMNPYPCIMIGEVVLSSGIITKCVSYAIQAKSTTDWFAISDNTNYIKQHNLGMQPGEYKLELGCSSNLNVTMEAIYDYDSRAYRSDGAALRGINATEAYIAIYALHAGIADVHNPATNSNIGHADRARVTVSRGW